MEYIDCVPLNSKWNVGSIQRTVTEKLHL